MNLSRMKQKSNISKKREYVQKIIEQAKKRDPEKYARGLPAYMITDNAERDLWRMFNRRIEGKSIKCTKRKKRTSKKKTEIPEENKKKIYNATGSIDINELQRKHLIDVLEKTNEKLTKEKIPFINVDASKFSVAELDMLVYERQKRLRDEIRGKTAEKQTEVQTESTAIVPVEKSARTLKEALWKRKIIPESEQTQNADEKQGRKKSITKEEHAFMAFLSNISKENPEHAEFMKKLIKDIKNETINLDDAVNKYDKYAEKEEYSDIKREGYEYKESRNSASAEREVAAEKSEAKAKKGGGSYYGGGGASMDGGDMVKWIVLFIIAVIVGVIITVGPRGILW